MPMGEVYSALAKGVLDGVIAPADTFRAMHFAEVTRHFTPLAIPRGAYPARAISDRRWTQLSAEHRAVLEEAIPVWEAALARETRAALETGLRHAGTEGVQVHTVSPRDQQAFDALYLRDAEENARNLARYGIDGMASFRTARASIGANDQIICRGNN